MGTAAKVESRCMGPALEEHVDDWQLWELKIPLGVACPSNPTDVELSNFKARCEHLITQATTVFEAEHPGSYPLNAEASFDGLLRQHDRWILSDADKLRLADCFAWHE